LKLYLILKDGNSINDVKAYHEIKDGHWEEIAGIVAILSEPIPAIEFLLQHFGFEVPRNCKFMH
jgi:hypothetical protein